MHWCTLAIPLFYSYLALHSFYHSGPGENMASGFQLWSEVMWAFYEVYLPIFVCHFNAYPILCRSTRATATQTLRTQPPLGTSHRYYNPIVYRPEH
eukprot:1158743-Pelagomonas_calceolata.AAC.45